MARKQKHKNTSKQAKQTQNTAVEQEQKNAVDVKPVESEQKEAHTPEPQKETAVPADTADVQKNDSEQKSAEPNAPRKPEAEADKTVEAEEKQKPEAADEQVAPAEPAKPVISYAEMKGEQHVQSVAVVGLQHLNQAQPLPCQDSVSAVTRPRSILLACDGAGSAAMSEVGSQALVTSITRLCQSIDPLIASLLDLPTPKPELESLVRVIIRHSMGVLQDLSTQHRRSIRDFRSTLNFAIVGKEQTLWMKVGDGEIVQERLIINQTDAGEPEYQSELICLGEHHQGEFANQTQFIDDHLKFDQVHWGVIPSLHLSGLALMSDGASEKLVAYDRSKIAGQISSWLVQLRLGKLKASDLCKRFYSEDFCKQSTGDDRSIALWARAALS